MEGAHGASSTLFSVPRPNNTIRTHSQTLEQTMTRFFMEQRHVNNPSSPDKNFTTMRKSPEQLLLSARRTVFCFIVSTTVFSTRGHQSKGERESENTRNSSYLSTKESYRRRKRIFWIKQGHHAIRTTKSFRRSRQEAAQQRNDSHDYWCIQNTRISCPGTTVYSHSQSRSSRSSHYSNDNNSLVYIKRQQQRKQQYDSSLDGGFEPSQRTKILLPLQEYSYQYYESSSHHYYNDGSPTTATTTVAQKDTISAQQRTMVYANG